MTYLYLTLFVLISALLWRIRGGLWKAYIPANKIWYAGAFAACGYFLFGNSLEAALIGFAACYASYQAFGIGLYVGRLLHGGAINPNLVQYRECELIDDLLYSLHITIKGQKYWLYQFPKVFGFVGTTLSGLVITFLWGLYFGSVGVMVSGLAMGLCYWVGGLLNKWIPEEKGGWGYGEYIFGAYLGAVLWRFAL